MNLNQLRHVVMVYRMGSFTAAAAELNISQSSVTKSVALVEQSVGYAIFDRRARGISITEAGRDFIDRAARIVSDMDQLVSDTATQRDEQMTMLRIGIAPPSLEGLLNHAIRSLLRDQEGLRLRVQAASTQRTMALLRQGDIDLMIGPTDELGRDQEFSLKTLPDFIGRLFCRHDHPLLANPMISKVNLRHYSIIVPDLSTPVVEQLVKFFYDIESSEIQLHILDNFSMVAGIVACTDALGIVSSVFAQTQTFQQKFQIVPNTLGYRIGLSIARRARWLPFPVMSKFLIAVQRYPPA